MKLCDRCPLAGGCLLNYLGKACRNARKKNAPDMVLTNADRIRDMSIKELAAIFVDAVADGCPPKMDWDCAKDEDGWDACEACWAKWLQQPAEED